MNRKLQILVNGCKRRDPKAQHQLYVIYADRMLGVCMRYTRSKDEAQDLMHDGFIKIFEHIGELSKPEMLFAWMKQVMIHTSVNYICRRKQLVYCDLRESSSNDTTWDTDQYRIEDVLKALQELPDELRVVFNMHEIDDINYKDIAQQLGMAESSVRHIVYKARKQLKENLMHNE